MSKFTKNFSTFYSKTPYNSATYDPKAKAKTTSATNLFHNLKLSNYLYS